MKRPAGVLAIPSLFVAMALLAACTDAKNQPAEPPVAASPATTASATPPPMDGASRFPDWPRTDFTRVRVNLDEVIRGCPAADCIPPLDAASAVTVPGERKGKATFVAVGEAELAAQMPVAAVVVNGEARGYPLHILTWHEIVNDVLGGTPVAVTFCPLCNTAISFDRRVDGTTLDFGVSGNLRKSDLIMWDRQTHSWWQQATGEGIVGVHAGVRLKAIATSVIGFSDFKAAHPDALVLSEDTGFLRDYGVNPYQGYDSPGSTPFLFSGKMDPRLDGLERVVTIDHEGGLIAVPFAALAKAGVANVEVGGAPFVVLWSKGTTSALGALDIASAADIGAAVAFDPRVDGRRLTFAPAADRTFRDTETGSTWTITGRATAGPLAGSQLATVPHTTQFWFAWAAFYPNTAIWQQP